MSPSSHAVKLYIAELYTAPLLQSGLRVDNRPDRPSFRVNSHGTENLRTKLVNVSNVADVFSFQYSSKIHMPILPQSATDFFFSGVNLA